MPSIRTTNHRHRIALRRQAFRARADRITRRVIKEFMASSVESVKGLDLSDHRTFLPTPETWAKVGEIIARETA